MTRPHLVLLHAFPLTSQIYLAQRSGLAEVAEVLTPDFRGFGGRRLGTDAPSLDVLADDVVRLLDDQGVDRAVVGGTSMGGYVALAVLRNWPDRVEALVLANTKATADAPAARENRERIATLVERENSVRVVQQEVEPKLLGATTAATRPDLVRIVEECVADALPATVAWAQRAMASRPDSLVALASCQVPVLVLAGSEDALMTSADAHAMADGVPGGLLEVLEGVGHLGCLEAPERWNAAVRALLLALD